MGSVKHASCGVLERLVGDADSFAAKHWGRHPAVFHDESSLDELLSSAAIADLLERSTRRPHFRMVRDGVTLSPHDSTRSLRIGGTPTPDVADPDLIGRQFAAGATLVMQSLERIHPPLLDFCRALHEEIGHPVQANAYLSPPTSSALARHADAHDVFVVQLEGSKAWDVEGLGPVSLDEGDVLYIPRGCHHAASTTQRHSLHLTLGVTAVTIRDVVRRAVAEFDDFDTPLPLGYHDESTSAELVELIGSAIADAAERLMAVDLGDIVHSEQRRVRRTAAGATGLRLELDLLRLDDDSVLSAHPDASVAATDDSVILTFGARTLRMPATAANALQALVGSDTIAVRDLSGLNERSRLVLARRLLREGAASLG